LKSAPKVTLNLGLKIGFFTYRIHNYIDLHELIFSHENGGLHMMNVYVFVLTMIMVATSAVSSMAKEYRVGVLYWSSKIPGQIAMSRGLENEARNINANAASKGGPTIKLITKIAGDGSDGIENQIRQMNMMIKEKVDVIIVQPTDNAALAEPLRIANKAGIKVVAYDQYISGGTLSAYRTSDNYQAGYLDGEYIASRFSKNRELRIVLVEYPHVSSTVERVNGFLDALNQAGQKFRILKTYTAVEQVGGKKAGKMILNDFPARGSIDVVFTVNDGGGLSVVEELHRAGRMEIQVATIDGDPVSVKYINEGKLIVIDSAQFCGPLGAEAVKAAYALIKGEKVPYHALVPVFPITRETLKLYPGWMGPIPPVFKKTWKSVSPEWRGEVRIVKH
jgi:ribose transport system substrate-binding protein